MNTMQTIMERASYRGTYLDEPVPRDDLEQILRAGLAAPSGCNKQTTSLIAVDDPAVMAGIFELIAPCVGSTAPAMICVLTQRLIAYQDRTFYVQDYSAAIQNMLLAAVALGYQSCWVEGHITDTDHLGQKIAALLNVPEDYELVCYLPIGKAGEPVRHAKKKPLEERVWFNGFGRKG